VLHNGDVLLGGIPSSGEESLAGPEVNFVFRLERLSSELKQERICSAAAAHKLKGLLPTNLAGDYPLSGFEGRFPVYTF
jgi:class 3 adenylate cyclase